MKRSKQLFKLNDKFKLNDRVYISLFKYGVSIVLFILLGSLLIMSQGVDPISATRVLFEGTFGSKRAFGNVLRWTAPCILTGAAASVAFKAGVMNLGIEGQVLLGGFVAGVLGAFLELPPALHILVCVIAGGIAGMLYAVIPAVLRLFFNINEFITTMMLNYVANFLTQYLTQQVLAGGLEVWGYVNMQATPTIQKSAVLPTIIPGTSATLAFPVALLIAFAIAFLYKRTIQGYELKQVGENLRFSKTGGVRVVRSFMTIFLLSGLIAGIAGGIEVIGTYKKFNTGFAAFYGYDGISIARIAELDSIAVIIVSFIWAVLKAGSMQVERVLQVNRLTVTILQYIFVLFVAIDYAGIYNRYQDRKIKKRIREGEL